MAKGDKKTLLTTDRLDNSTHFEKDVQGNYKVSQTVLDGVKGDDGQGLPEGGTAGQIPSKKSSTDFDIEWINPPTGGGVVQGTPASHGSWSRNVNGALADNPFLPSDISENSTPLGISNVNGEFVFSEAGSYKLLISLNLEEGLAQDILLKKNDVVILTVPTYVHAAVDPVERTISTILELESGDKISVAIVGMPKVGCSFTAMSVSSKGEKGDSFVYSDFTQAQLDLLKGEKGDTGTVDLPADIDGLQSTPLYTNTGMTADASNKIITLSESINNFSHLMVTVKEAGGTGDARQSNTQIVDVGTVVTADNQTATSISDTLFFPLDGGSAPDRLFLSILSETSVQVVYSLRSFVRNIVGINYKGTQGAKGDDGVAAPTDLTLIRDGNTCQLNSSTGNFVNLPLVTQAQSGVMSREDKTKLDGIPTTTVSSTEPSSPNIGDTWVNDKINIWNGTVWISNG